MTTKHINFIKSAIVHTWKEEHITPLGRKVKNKEKLGLKAINKELKILKAEAKLS